VLVKLVKRQSSHFILAPNRELVELVKVVILSAGANSGRKVGPAPKSWLRRFLLKIHGFSGTLAANPIPHWSVAMFNLAFMLQHGIDPDQIQHIVVAMMAILPLIILVCLAIVIVPFWFICKKAGFSPWLSLLNIVPMGNLILIYVLAFAQWKVVPVPQLGYPPPYPQPPLPPQLPPQQ
jgi:hypothetical protein